ncbi:MAG: RluA family pseudouridine synthase [Rhodospirillaceae bacterium]
MSRVEHRTVTDAETDVRLDRWFRRHFPSLNHGRLEKLLRKGDVRVDGKRVRSNYRLKSGQDIRIPPLSVSNDTELQHFSSQSPPDPKLVQMLIEGILYEDKDVLVINKPAGIATQGGSGVTSHIDGALDALKRGAQERPRLVHRLDKDTAGVLVLARSAKAAADLTHAFRQRDTKKIYWAVVVGCPRVPDGTIEGAVAKHYGSGGERMRIDTKTGKSAVTEFKVISSAADKVSWLELQPREGRTHQLRLHCAGMATPILGDGKYGGRAAFLADLPGAKKMHLFARSLNLVISGKKSLTVNAPLPPHIAATFSYFGFEE